MHKGYALLVVAVMGQATNNDGVQLLGQLGFYTLIGATAVLIEGSDSVSLSVDKTNFDYGETKADGSLLDTEKTLSYWEERLVSIQKGIKDSILKPVLPQAIPIMWGV